MGMSKPYANALILLGIAVSTAFFLLVPAVASPVQGLAALKSGELLQSPLSDLLSAEVGFGSSGLPYDEGAPDLTADTEPVASAEPENPSQPADPVSRADAPAGGAGSDDEELAGLIDANSVPLVRLSMEHAHALYLQDAGAASAAAGDLHALSDRLLDEVQPLQVSPEQQPVKDEFVRSLLAYSSASETLVNSTDAGTDSVQTAFRDLDIASESLETVSQQAVEVQPASMGLSTMSATSLAADAPAVLAETYPVPVAPPEEALPLGERYTYDDPSGENMVSLIAASTRNATAFEEVSINATPVPTNASPARVEAGDGRMFLLVAIQSTNLGHKGDSDLYTIETPGREAFTLEYQGVTFESLEVPPFTSLGESSGKKPLERYESTDGYLYFDVPATFDVSGAILRADLGDAGTPAWDLGRELGEEPDDAVAV